MRASKVRARNFWVIHRSARVCQTSSNAQVTFRYIYYKLHLGWHNFWYCQTISTYWYLCVIATSNIAFHSQIAVQRHYFMVSKILNFADTKGGGGGAGPPPSEVGEPVSPRSPGCYAYEPGKHGWWNGRGCDYGPWTPAGNFPEGAKPRGLTKMTYFWRAIGANENFRFFSAL